MAKKKRSSKTSTVETEPAALNVADSRKRMRTFEDVADSDDEFHLNRDKILLEEEPAAKRRRKTQEDEAFLEESEEEVLERSNVASEEEYSDLSEDGLDAQDEEEEDEEEEEEEEEGWGASKGDTYGTDAIETEEQALEEEAEARRLQKKQLQSMSAADYGFDEDDWKESTVPEKAAVITETLPEPEVPVDASPAERLKVLKSRYPEFEPLSKELLLIDADVTSLAKTLASSTSPMPKTRTKHDAASAYLGALTTYFALLTSSASRKSSNTALSAKELRDHDIMTLLVECRQTWQKAKSLSEDAPIVDELMLDELENESMDEMGADQGLSVEPEPKIKKSRKARHAEAVEAARQTRIAENLKRTEAENADLDALLGPVKRNAERKSAAEDSDIGAETALTAAQAEEKAKRRKSLRFYTSQIAQKANKRGAAGRTAGGDDDIPHRERLRDRQARLNAEAEKRGKRGEAGDDLGDDSDAGDAEQARQIRQAVDEDDEYYDMFAARTAKKKLDKVAYGEAQKRAREQGGVVIEQATVGADGKRKISYAIEKNKGLTPFRKKDVRNPRVKKRKKFEEKSKKLATMKATYKGGEGRGGYGGELTGIKSNLVKSTKL
ncbi:hypothetical protein AMS68_007706 [Peltaster fructicola]|uniref:Sas10 C-terminal domain-containing protein n=1 Tax=Peltaster fructicola TaxID=286661 RepID=A0A6H0Y5T7_9PEZI|nr:hypothetical protein AMS68_007706 [Peltaster fructicola]